MNFDFEQVAGWCLKESEENLIEKGGQSTWVVQLVDCPTLGFSSCHELRVLGSSPALGSTLSFRILSLSLSLPLPLPLLACDLSLSNK